MLYNSFIHLWQSAGMRQSNWINEVIKNMPDKVLEYKKGKKTLIGLFAGEVKKLSKGKADMKMVNQLLSENLNK